MDDVAMHRRTGLDPADLTGFYLEDLYVGMKGVYARTITETDIVMFAGISGDTNPMHLNEEYAKQTPFGGRIAHGMLSACFITTVLGTRLPGPGCIYMSQTLRFRAPVRIGETVTTTVTVQELVPEKRRALLSTICTVADHVVIEGEAMVMVPGRPG
ncbi:MULTISPECIES: MaoC family dehydratase [Azospirillaceae]|uniref:MaoC family dehydratase n=1 Tax=Azospirillaceae TaxID=2829815 RepID=UPI000B717A78|nr:MULTISPECIES: MaoC family dehydratase [Azospirillaceae]MDG5495505.1 MaoC family dehydratase [Niveispirillum sp. BGYR6]SNS28652.1 3-hydroxybutyryl-CoA dehydratase [Azospirillum sp. RU38E]SNS47149.1 3-hydroxybutyryl-CoA dehydratase [Azospirillum sp. RU37A]